MLFAIFIFFDEVSIHIFQWFLIALFYIII